MKIWWQRMNKEHAELGNHERRGDFLENGRNLYCHGIRQIFRSTADLEGIWKRFRNAIWMTSQILKREVD